MLQYFDNDKFYMTDDKRMILNRCHEVHELLKKAYWAKDRSESVTQNKFGTSS